MSFALPALLMHHLRAAPPPVAEAAAARCSGSSSGSADLRVPALWCIINLTVGGEGAGGALLGFTLRLCASHSNVSHSSQPHSFSVCLCSHSWPVLLLLSGSRADLPARRLK